MKIPKKTLRLMLAAFAIAILGFFGLRALLTEESKLRAQLDLASNKRLKFSSNAFANSGGASNLSLSQGEAEEEESEVEQQKAAGAGSSPKDNLSPRELESLEAHLLSMRSFNDGSLHHTEWFHQLKNWGLEPEMAETENEDTGKMIVIRTLKAMDGTRHLHAQFFEDGEGGFFPQHLSFEVRPSANSEAMALEKIQKIYSGLGEPTYQKPGFREWKTRNCLTVWMKEMTAEDFQDDPDNAYQLPQDLGTFKVAQELDPHCHEADPHHQ